MQSDPQRIYPQHVQSDSNVSTQTTRAVSNPLIHADRILTIFSFLGYPFGCSPSEIVHPSSSSGYVNRKTRPVEESSNARMNVPSPGFRTDGSPARSDKTKICSWAQDCSAPPSLKHVRLRGSRAAGAPSLESSPTSPVFCRRRLGSLGWPAR